MAAWLRRQDDVLKRTGEPTWLTLIHALKDIGQNGVAEDILKEKIQHHGSSDKSQGQQTTGSKSSQQIASKNNGYGLYS